MLANFFVPVLGDGWRFIALFAGMTFLGALTGVAWLFWPLMVITLWSIYFFRDPPRGVPQDDGVLIAPADGLVQMIVDAVPPAELGLGEAALTRISITSDRRRWAIIAQSRRKVKTTGYTRFIT